ncbi:eukaryotic translation initiation factor 4E-1-like [Phalaenopsis equestris]|uniref:eukaryotic translation initiation factor 4E-1-like n=1 Tax=Phalaenopsis equestris TaxID=78828 RepID=UPI0009E2DE27|nr:eukaryotic translation initiation factor 4E-1-like [Phalaenopsis equestris]
MEETKMAFESRNKVTPADETAIHPAAEENNVAGDQTFTGAAASPAKGGSFGRTLRRHPLEHSWTFWFNNPSGKTKGAAWGSSIIPVHTLSTVEDFWGLYNNIHQPSRLAVGADFHCFKRGIEPKWEDPVCEKGGKWTISCSRGSIDVLWLYTLLAMLGEQFDNGDEICGAVVNVRLKQERISIWTKNAFKEAAQEFSIFVAACNFIFFLWG